MSSRARIGELIGDGARRLAIAGIEGPRREARLLLGFCLELTEAELMARDDQLVDDASTQIYGELVAERSEGVPAAYLLGEREFYGRSFRVDRRVLIPRPETEHVVETALEHARPGIRVLDLGTGSGCIGLSLALESKHSRGSLGAVQVTCSDRSLAALAVARTNRRRLSLDDDVALVCADLDHGLELDRFELIVSNPPYVDPGDTSLQASVRDFEPSAALFPQPTEDVQRFPGGIALAFYRRLLGDRTSVARGTTVVLEIGKGQGDEIVELASPRFELVDRRADYAGIERVLVLRRC